MESCQFIAELEGGQHGVFAAEGQRAQSESETSPKGRVGENGFDDSDVPFGDSQKQAVADPRQTVLFQKQLCHFEVLVAHCQLQSILAHVVHRVEVKGFGLFQHFADHGNVSVFSRVQKPLLLRSEGRATLVEHVGRAPHCLATPLLSQRGVPPMHGVHPDGDN
ncbi:hypothetical protein EYF80_012036 [Liparis tanakae]|uniref:Uncharacterized protein n=1 Tax=Liparis tanakae TaxID=230148 RepID=A0A4Z2IIT9_9TELE|nr:hypothetical protein EYF80_012036 [Liparis tanakae]